MLVKLKAGQFTTTKERLKGRKILVEDIGKKIILCNGKDLFRLTLNENMVGYYFLDFVFTKALGNGIHLKKKSKKKIKK